MRERQESGDALPAHDVAHTLVYSFAQHPGVSVEEVPLNPFQLIAP